MQNVAEEDVSEDFFAKMFAAVDDELDRVTDGTVPYAVGLLCVDLVRLREEQLLPSLHA